MKIFIVPLIFFCFMAKELVAQSCRPAKGACELGWNGSVTPRTCLSHTYQMLNWADARKYCQNLDADLVVTETYAMLNFVIDYLRTKSYDEYWLGLTRNTGNDWKWEVGGAKLHPVINLKTWAKSEPKKGATCAFIESDELRWYGVGCEEKKNYICEKPKIGDVCIDHWHSTNLPHDNQCIQRFNIPETYAEATKKCNEKGANLLRITSTGKSDAVNWFIKIVNRVWLGLNDNDNEGEFVWLRGKKANFTIWSAGEPNGGIKENCVMLQPLGTFVDTPCWNLVSIMCQKTSKVGPSKIVMEVLFERGTSNVFNDDYLIATCEAENTETRSITWAAFDKNKRLMADVTPHMLHTAVIESDKDGICRNRTRSSYRLQMSKAVDGMYLTCYSYFNHTMEFCSNPGGVLVFCAVSNQIKVVDRKEPKRPPSLSFTYKGYPNPILPRTNVTVTCTAPVGTQLYWVVYFKSGPHALSANDPKIRTNQDSTNVTSVLQFPMKISISGVSMACFTYDAKKYNPSFQCNKTYGDCDITPAIIAKKEPSKSSSSWLWYLLTLLVLATIIGIISSPYVALMKKGEGEESPYRGQVERFLQQLGILSKPHKQPEGEGAD